MMYCIRWLIYLNSLAAELRHNAKKLLQQKDLLTSEGLDDIQSQIDYLTKVFVLPQPRGIGRCYRNFSNRKSPTDPV